MLKVKVEFADNASVEAIQMAMNYISNRLKITYEDYESNVLFRYEITNSEFYYLKD